MHLILKIFSIFHLILFIYALPPCREVVYDHYLLALTWPNQFCSENYCVMDWHRVWDGKSMIIHGLWPGSKDLAYVTCLKQNDHDPYCHQPFTFQDFLFTSTQMAQMKKYWPKLSNPRNFWSHEWMKHGTCYLDILKNKLKSTESTTKLFKSYFIETVNKAKKLNISLSKSKVQTKEDLAKTIKVDVNNFYAVCGSDNQLDEIRICYGISGQAGKQTQIKCPSSRDYNLCTFPITIK